MRQPQKMNEISANAPGKIIISGEHAVVAGAPAIAIPTHKKLQITLRKRADDKVICTSNGFTQQTYKIADINAYQSNPQQPFNLLCCTLNAANKLTSLAHGIDINIASDIEIGCGFGSSAALIVATLKAYCLMTHTDITHAELINLATQLESIQHAKSSGIDVIIAVTSSAIYFDNQTINYRQYKPQDWVIINTGQRSSSTAESVRHTQNEFNNNPLLINAFTSVCNSIDKDLQTAAPSLANNLRYNQQLLQKIGVVPENVTTFIKKAYALGATVKITGAGSIQGNSAGALLALRHPALEKLCSEYNYTLETI